MVMFKAFEKNYRPDHIQVSDRDGVGVKSQVVGLRELIDRFGGVSFNGALYRIVCATDSDAWAARIAYAFPEFKGRITCFGYDWLGRAFAVDSLRLEEGRPGVAMFEPGSGQVLQIPANIESFHDKELIEHGEAALATDLYHRWLAGGGLAPARTQCIGYKRALFLGGNDDLTNLEITDLDVYWHVFGQLIVKTKSLSAGTPVRVKLS
jgi:hypothetical protein